MLSRKAILCFNVTPLFESHGYDREKGGERRGRDNIHIEYVLGQVLSSMAAVTLRAAFTSQSKEGISKWGTNEQTSMWPRSLGAPVSFLRSECEARRNGHSAQLSETRPFQQSSRDRRARASTDFLRLSNSIRKTGYAQSLAFLIKFRFLNYDIEKRIVLIINFTQQLISC